MQSRRIAPPLDLRAELAADDDEPVKQAPARAPAKAKTVNKRLVLKRLYRKEPKLKLNTFVAKAILQEPKLKLREAEGYFKLRRQQDKQAKAKDPKRRKVRKDKETATSRIGGLSEEQQKLLENVFYRQHKGTVGVRALYELLKQTDTDVEKPS